MRAPSPRRRKALFYFIGIPAALCLVYAYVLLPRMSRWGATQGEIDAVLPGDHLVHRAKMNSTRAITIQRPPEAVYPWLVQIGQSRGGFYSYDWLENLIGCDFHSAGRIVPEWQNLKPGDPIGIHPRVREAFSVEELQPNRYVLLRGGGSPGQPATNTWLFYLWRTNSGNTRLIVRTRGTFGSSPVEFVMWRVLTEPMHFVMERAMLKGLRDRVELSAPPAASPVPQT